MGTRDDLTDDIKNAVEARDYDALRDIALRLGDLDNSGDAERAAAVVEIARHLQHDPRGHTGWW